MSGFFMMRRSFSTLCRKLSGRGFKVLLDLLASAPEPLRVAELPMRSGRAHSGSSKLDLPVELAFIGMLFDKALGGVVSPRFLAFSSVGGTGVVVHLAVLKLALAGALAVRHAQAIAAILAMTSNFWLNNLTTYRDKRLAGRRFLTGFCRSMRCARLGSSAMWASVMRSSRRTFLVALGFARRGCRRGVELFCLLGS